MEPDVLSSCVCVCGGGCSFVCKQQKDRVTLNCKYRQYNENHLVFLCFHTKKNTAKTEKCKQRYVFNVKPYGLYRWPRVIRNIIQVKMSAALRHGKQKQNWSAAEKNYCVTGINQHDS